MAPYVGSCVSRLVMFFLLISMCLALGQEIDVRPGGSMKIEHKESQERPVMRRDRLSSQHGHLQTEEGALSHEQAATMLQQPESDVDGEDNDDEPVSDRAAAYARATDAHRATHSRAFVGSTPKPDSDQEVDPSEVSSPMPVADTSDDAMKGLPLFVGTMMCCCSCWGGFFFVIWYFCLGGMNRSSGNAQPAAGPDGGALLAAPDNARSYRQTRQQRGEKGSAKGGAPGQFQAPALVDPSGQPVAEVEEQHF